MDNKDSHITNDIMDDVTSKDSSKGKRGRPAHVPNENTRNRVYELSTVGTRHEDIAKVLSISVDTLTKYYTEELELGRIEANAAIAGTLFAKAKGGDTTSMIFWMKTRAKWSETQKHEIGGDPEGEPVQIKVITGIE